MSSNPFANEEVMEDYMSALLTDEPIVENVQKQAVEQLLKTAPAVRSEPFIPKPKERIAVKPITAKVIQPKVEEEVVSERKKVEVIRSVVPKSEFQVMLFEIAGMTLAVQLTELGGIHQIDSINPLFGKPSWFKGVFLHRDEKFNVVDTAKWIMPEKSAEKLAESTKYQYLIVLGDSGWGLGCEALVTTDTLLPEDVKWRDVTTSRPWLSGMVKKKMCALVNVPQLVSMLDQGLSSKD
jgi:purine-binding chemotaxis protein CheW